MALESRFTDIAGHRVHYLEGGTGFPVLMLHGVGPGTSIVGNFGPVLEPLAEQFHIIAADLIGFGEPDAKKTEPFAEGWMNENGVYLGRPVDVQQYVDGSILVSDDKAGAVYRISYQGK